MDARHNGEILTMQPRMNQDNNNIIGASHGGPQAGIPGNYPWLIYHHYLVQKYYQAFYFRLLDFTKKKKRMTSLNVASPFD